MLLSIIDTETTGLIPENSEIIELGIILHDSQSGQVIEQYSTLIPRNSNEAYTANKISAKTSRLASPNILVAQSIVDRSDYTLIHNKGFDINFLKKHDFLKLSKPVICTMAEIRWAHSNPKSRKLSDIALEHGIPCWNLHRALTDCRLISDILSKYTHEEIEVLIEEAILPKNLYISLEPKPSPRSKEAGFRWNHEDAPYKWSKYLNEREVKNSDLPLALFVKN